MTWESMFPIKYEYVCLPCGRKSLHGHSSKVAEQLFAWTLLEWLVDHRRKGDCVVMP